MILLHDIFGLNLHSVRSTKAIELFWPDHPSALLAVQFLFCVLFFLREKESAAELINKISIVVATYNYCSHHIFQGLFCKEIL